MAPGEPETAQPSPLVSHSPHLRTVHTGAHTGVPQEGQKDQRSLLAGGFTLDSAESVCEASLADISSLVDNSLVAAARPARLSRGHLLGRKGRGWCSRPRHP